MIFDPQDIDLVREHFPALTRTYNGRPIAYFDGPGGTQVPRQVLDAIETAYIERNANFDGAFSTSIDNTAATQRVRESIAAFLGAESAQSISFGANMTTLNYALSHAIARTLKPGDELIVTALDHEANRGPWLGLAAQGIVIREVAIGENGTLDYADFEEKLTPNTKCVAVGLASNSLGTVNDIKRIIASAKQVDALVVGDAVHYAAHFPVDTEELGIDFLLCSAYKFYGPHVGILYAKPGLLDSLETDRLSTQEQHAPYRIETGTLNYPALAGVEAAVEFIGALGEGNGLRTKSHDAMNRIHGYEMQLAKRYWQGLKQFSWLDVHGPDITSTRTPTVSFSSPLYKPQEIAEHLADRAVQVWHGHFYAQRVLDSLGLSEKGGLVRVGLSMYNTELEVERLLTALEDFTRRHAG